VIETPRRKVLPYIYLAYLAVVLVVFVFRPRVKPSVQEEP
jgi:hypothetical protein